MVVEAFFAVRRAERIIPYDFGAFAEFDIHEKQIVAECICPHFFDSRRNVQIGERRTVGKSIRSDVLDAVRHRQGFESAAITERPFADRRELRLRYERQTRQIFTAVERSDADALDVCADFDRGKSGAGKRIIADTLHRVGKLYVF